MSELTKKLSSEQINFGLDGQAEFLLMKKEKCPTLGWEEISRINQ